MTANVTLLWQVCLFWYNSWHNSWHHVGLRGFEGTNPRDHELLPVCTCLDRNKNQQLWKNNFRVNIFYFVYSCEVGSHSPLQHERDPETELIHDFFFRKEMEVTDAKWKSSLCSRGWKVEAQTHAGRRNLMFYKRLFLSCSIKLSLILEVKN